MNERDFPTGPPIGPGLLIPGAIVVLIVVACVIAVPILLGALRSEGASCGTSPASESAGAPKFESGSGSWVATAYGPPWGGIQGEGVTATGIDLRPAKHDHIIAVDPSLITMGSDVRVTPNPFNDNSITFLAADTGGAIIGKHIDIYDWRGRTYQDDWGERKVTVTVLPKSGAGSILGPIEAESFPVACAASTSGPVPLTPGQRAKILPNGSAAAPTEIPGKAGEIVRAIIAAGNEINSKPYPEPDQHYGPLREMWPAYDCSGSTSYVLYKAGLHSVNAEVSGELENWGEPGPGKYLTIYANSGHVFVSVAGIAFNTAAYTTPNPSGSGPRWQPGSTVSEQLSGDPNGFVARHWPGT